MHLKFKLGRLTPKWQRYSLFYEVVQLLLYGALGLIEQNLKEMETKKEDIISARAPGSPHPMFFNG